MSGEGGSGGAVKAPKRAALGRGLGALLGETRREEALVRPAPAPAATPTAGGVATMAPVASSAVAAGPTVVATSASTGIAMLPVAEIEPHPDQPRRHFDEEALDELAQSIAARG
jgi:ParB family chromosome partitioning protein